MGTLIDMTINAKKFPFRVSYPRTANWWASDWREIVEWLAVAVGTNNWEYINEDFVFKDKESAVMFKLRWNRGDSE